MALQTLESEDISERTRRVSTYVSNDEKCIYGLQLRSNDKVLFNQNWYEDDKPNYRRQWKHFSVPSGKEVIGVYGDLDQHVITALGLVVWVPDSNAT